MRLTGEQAREHARRCAEFDRSWFRGLKDADLRACAASVAEGNHDGTHGWRVWTSTKRGRTTTSRGLPFELSALRAELERRGGAMKSGYATNTDA